MSAATATTPMAADPGATRGNPSSHPYTCHTCQVAYRNADLQRGHMKTDWHRYNLKRRLASMLPITPEAFAQRALQARAEAAAQAGKSLFEKTCDACEKTFRSENSYQNHLLSRKHKLREVQVASQPKAPADDGSSVLSSTFSLGEPLPNKAAVTDEDSSEDDGVDSDAEEEFTQVVEGLQKVKISENRPSPVKRPSNPTAIIAAGQATPLSEGKERGSSSATPTPPDGDTSVLQQCLFCRYTSPTVRLNAHHMERFHSMYIPEPDYLVDLEGLLMHLHKRVYEDCMCLTCGKVKANPFAVQTHMRDVGHCTIPFTTIEEQLDIGDFYDFRSTYSDSEEDEEDEEMEDGEAKGGAKLGAKRSGTTTGEDGEEVEEDGWETDSSVSSFDSEELTAVLADDRQNQLGRLEKSHHHSHTDPRSHRMADGYHSHAHKHGAHAVFYDEYELHLPTGKSVGHRQHARYYRQNLHNYPSAEERGRQLAIEAGEGDGNGSQAQHHGGRELLVRGNSGITGVSEYGKTKIRKAVLESRTAEGRARMNVGPKKLTKTYAKNYQYDRGG